MPNRSDLAEVSHILGVINDVFARHRDGTLSDDGSRRALSAFIASYPVGGRLSSDHKADIEAYLDWALQVSQRATSSFDADTAACARVVMGVAVGNAAALHAVRGAARPGPVRQMAVSVCEL